VTTADPHPSRPLAGAVLCGGHSRRMGTDKAFVEVAGVPMAELVAAALVAGGCEPVVLVGGDTELLARFGHPVVPDRFPGQGPAGGVLSTLDAVPPAAVARAVADGAGAAAVAVTDRWQPSLTAWRTSARGDLERAWTGGARALHELIAAVPHVEVAVDPEVLRNVNTRDELSAAEDASR
jgi:molybdopterin-guanine dinucleotide biosynthesis protein A